MKSKLLFVGLTALWVWPVWAQPQLTKAQQLMSENKPQEAITELRQAVAVNPKNLEAWTLLGEAFLRTNQPDSALYAGRQARDIDGRNPAGYVITSRAEAVKKDFKAAYASIRNGLKSVRSNKAPLLTQQGMLHLAMDSTNQAMISFSQAKEADPKNAPAYAGLGETWMKLGNPGMAILQMETYAKLDSSDAELMERLANTLEKERRYTEAAKWYNRVVRLDTNKAEPLFKMGTLYFRGKQYGNSSRAFQVYTRRFSNDDEGWKYYMESLYLSKQYRDALAAAERVRTKEPNSPLVTQILAHSNFELRQHDQALANYQQLVKLVTLDSLALEHKERLGKSHVAVKQDSLAAPLLEDVARKDTSRFDLYSDLGAMYMRMRKWSLAAEAFEKRSKREPGHLASYVNFGLSTMALGRFDSARAALRKVVELRPDYLPGHLYLARSLSAMDSSQAAIKEFETVIKLADTAVVRYKNELAESHGRIGVTHLVDKRYPLALEALNASIKFKSDNPDTRLWRAQTYALMNRRDEAVAEYRAVLKLDPRNKYAKEDLAKFEAQ